MISRFVISAILGATLFGSACAKEAEPASQTTAAAADTCADGGFCAPDSAWRTPAQDNLLYVTTNKGLIVVELIPEIAPNHVTQIKALAQKKFYDMIVFHRVIDGFMNQTGDPTGTGMGDSDLPDIPGEFTFRRDSSMPVSLLNRRQVNPRDPNAGIVDVGFYKSFPVATRPISDAGWSLDGNTDGKVDAWGLHCSGVTSMARSAEPNSANSQFFLLRGTAPWLDQQYSVWGNTVYGRQHLTEFNVGVAGEDAGFVPDQMETVRLGSDLPENEQLAIQVLKTDGPDYRRFIANQKLADGTYPDICEIVIPTRIKP
ncbi:peptidylprolyl isomerase [Robiginitomaculum antarcticum]|uniref:peptidylprolyl isomerase n=1 Tax=Robiginitomaculum antarcticum TaxID=437507 RepID=UPI000373FF31|nr:peptidylprolyl isomerase [Robiginitomaculum antarcticum]